MADEDVPAFGGAGGWVEGLVVIPETLHAPLTGLMLVVMVCAIASGRFAVDVVVVGTLMVLLLAGVVSPEDAVHGYANTSLATIGFLYVVAAGLRETGAIGMISGLLLGRPKSVLVAQARMVPVVAVMSAFANNTPIVATFMPALIRLSRRTGLPLRQLLIPLSFAAIFGGLCTLIGTSTTLVVSGLLRDFQAQYPDQDIPTMEMFTVTPVGLSMAVVGIAYIMVMGRALLPGAGGEMDEPVKVRQYITAVRVTGESPVVGKTIEEAGLRQLTGLFLSRIERRDETIIAVSPRARVREGDVLVFVGLLESVLDLMEIRGLEPLVEEQKEGEEAGGEKARSELRLVEAVVSGVSPLVGRTVRDAGIRTRYGAVVVAVHRLGHKLQGKIGDVRLRPGDTLLLEAEPGFQRKYGDSGEFYLVSESEEAATPRHDKVWFAHAILLGFVGALTLGQFGLLPSAVARVATPMPMAMLAAGMMLLTRCCRGVEARRAIDWQVLVVIGAAFGLGRAMENSGLSDLIADPLIEVSSGVGLMGSLAMVYFLTVVFTTFVTNSAAAVLMFPIAFAVAGAQGHPVMAYAVCIAMAASAEFTTPLGYQTNLMVMGPGGYRFMDYVRFGGPLTVLSGVVAVLVSSVWFGG